MRSTKILVAIVLTVFIAVFATTAFAAPLPNGSILFLDPGSGSTVNTPCATGSCFGMEQAPGTVLWTDFAPGTDGGIVLGKDQQPGSLIGGTEMGDLSDAWNFFQNWGTFATAAFCGGSAGCVSSTSSANTFDNASCLDAASCAGKTTLGTWHVSWNGVAVPMGMSPSCLSTSPENCIGVTQMVYSTGTAAVGSTYVLDYAWAVPDNDPSGFGNVPFYLILRGTVTAIVNPCSDAATRCNDGNACTTDTCDPVTGACGHTNLANGTTCTLTNKCLLSPTCTNGICGGTPKVCNDNNPCTSDSCTTSTGLCKFTAISGGTCNDNNACTLNDTCVVGVCKGTPNNCSDNNVCTTDTCDTATGVCSSMPVGGTCGLPCDSTTAPGMALMPAGTVLRITQGVGSAINTPCSAGSCFSMEVAPGTISWTDFGPGTDGGIVVGKSQKSGGQELAPSATNTIPGELSNAWFFFNNYGTFYTVPGGDTKDSYCNTSCSGADCIKKTELKVFNVAWNGSIIPLGSEAGCTLSNCSSSQKEGIFVNSWTINPVIDGAWSMNYSQVVPSGGFTNVKFSAIIRGRVLMGDICPEDGNPCTDDVLVNNVCVHIPNTAPCNDNNACTVNDICTGGVCAGTPRNCGDNNACTIDTCDMATGSCVFTPVNCDDNNACTTDTCNTATGCDHTPRVCSDNNPCTTDSCNPAFGCVYTPIVCSDNNPCTIDTCDTAIGACVHTPGPCASPLPNGSKLLLDTGAGSAANVPCVTGSCYGMAQGPGLVFWTDFGPGTDGGIVVGKNQVPGEIDAAWSFFGNVGHFYTAPNASANAFDNTSCLDAASCLGKTTLGSWNVDWNGITVPLGSAQGCLTSTPANCIGVSLWRLNPDPAVTGSTFELNYAWAVPDGDPSGFGNVPFYLVLRGTASVVDLCADAATRCNDNNACTNDLCDPQTGACIHIPVANGTACTSANQCLLNPTCFNGVCGGTAAKLCNDNNPCTIDTCTTSTGACKFTPISGGTCNDGNACTLNDTCVSGVCKGTPKNCSDNNVCSTDTCDTATGVCSSTPVGGTCGFACDSTTAPGMALMPAGTVLHITQGVGSGINVPCSVGSCFSMEVSPGTLAWTDFGSGTDGGIVVGKSQTSGGQETSPSAINTTPGELSNAWSFFGAYGTFYTVPGGDTKDIYCNTSCSGADCIKKTELKVFNVAWNGSIIPLGSEAGCTLSNCSSAQKEGIFVNNWTIDPVTGWSMSYSQVVPSGGFTNVKFSAIIRGTNLVCTCPDDGNPCTDDACVNGVCQHTPKNCNDNNACTADSCNAGVCVHTTIQGCDLQCAGQPDRTPCSLNYITYDPSVCHNDYCSNGVCVKGIEQHCDDNNVCTTDTCVEAYGGGFCVFTNNTAACSDGNACTVNDTCSNGTCVSGTPKNCDDGNCCTTDSCDPTAGACVNSAIPGCGTSGTPLTNTMLGIDMGSGSAPNTPCATGSCFGMEVQPGYVMWTDFGPGTDGGFVTGKAQTCSELSSTWNFFGSDGCFNTTPGGETNLFDSASCTGLDCVNKTALNVFNVFWGGGTIPMGSACGVSDYQINGNTWNMSYSSVVPGGPMQGVHFSMIIRGMNIRPDLCMDFVTRCNDGDACTTDSCEPATGACVHTAVVCDDNNVCTTNSCNPTTGCVYTPINCDDNNACTADGCNPTSGCYHMPIICNDNNACTTDSCNTVTGCAFTPVVNGTPCPIGSCYAGGCYPPIGECGECVGDSQCPSNMRCDVGNGCYPSCDCLPGGPCPTVCTHHCVPACNDNDLCTIDTYDPIRGCVFTPIMCDDNNTCTTDSCDPAIGVCTYSPLADGSLCTLDSQPGSCTAGQCIPYPACPAGSVKNVVVRGGGQKPSGADLQIQTSFTVMNAGCIVDSSASSVTCTAGTILQINFSAGQGPNPTTATWQNNTIPTDTNLTITCTAGEVYKLDLDNRDAAGGKDVDRITINVQ